MPFPEDVLSRFFDKFDATDDDDCWPWKAGIGKKGYGHFWIDGKTVMAHRVSYQVHIGEIGEGLCVCHACDNPVCVNPNHLWLGAPVDNTQDMINKGRNNVVCGEKHHYSKLSEKEVMEIRRIYSKGNISCKALGKRFNISAASVCLIVNRKTWASI